MGWKRIKDSDLVLSSLYTAMNFTSYDFFDEGEQRPSNAVYFQTVQNKSLNTEKLYYFTKIEQKIKKICKHDDKKYILILMKL